jgi:hypothetical protein
MAKSSGNAKTIEPVAKCPQWRERILLRRAALRGGQTCTCGECDDDGSAEAAMSNIWRSHEPKFIEGFA